MKIKIVSKPRLNKKNLGDFLESSCDRQLFANLGIGDQRWISPPHTFERPTRQFVGNYIIKLGKEYETQVYNSLIKNDQEYIKLNPDWNQRGLILMMSNL